MAIPGRVIKPLVESSREFLTEMLRFVGDREVIGFSSGRGLRVQDTKRILKECRVTDEPAVLSGAATMLQSSRFAGVATAEVLAKVLASAPSSGLVSRLFRGSGESLVDNDARKRERELSLSRGVAGLVLSEPDQYSFRVVKFAASFVVETEASDVVPVFVARPDLMDPEC